MQKNVAYKPENEIRYIVECNDNATVKFKIKNGVIIPYVEIIIPKECLDSIVIGPTNNSMLTKSSVETFLSINGYDLKQVKVTPSEVPYRG